MTIPEIRQALNELHYRCSNLEELAKRQAENIEELRCQLGVDRANVAVPYDHTAVPTVGAIAGGLNRAPSRY